MKPQQRSFNPEMLVLARESRGMTQSQLAERVGVTQSKISKLEDGLMELSDDTAGQLADVLHYPPHFFHQAGSLESASPTFYRKYMSLPKLTLRQSVARMNIMKRQIKTLLASAEPIETRIPRCDPDEFAGGPRAIAKHVRLLSRLPAGPVRNLVQVVENAGCIVVKFDFGTRQIDGCSDFIDATPIVFLNTHLMPARMRFTLAHELGHIVMHTVPGPDDEDEANAFASEFLMPEDDIKSTLLPMSLDRLARLKLHWRTSMQALLKRAEDLNLITERTARYYWTLMSKCGYRQVEPHEADIPRENPTLLKELVDMHLQDLGCTTEELGEKLAVKDEEFLALYQFQSFFQVA